MTAIGVLGPVLLDGPDGPVRIGSARQRRLLAALVAHLGVAVDTALLAEIVFDTAPADPAGAVQTHVARLRRLLPPDVRIATTPEGYRLVADRANVDVTAFADHIVAAAAVTDPPARVERLDSALRLWRGRPYAELDHPTVHPELARLGELRAGAIEQHAAALLAAGRPAEAVAELDALTGAEPLREGAVALLMRALVAAGRQSDALAAYGRLRTRLADELGLDPAPELRALEQQVLRQEIAGPAPAPERVPAPAPAPKALLPALPISSFVGRDAAMARAGELLARARVVTLCGPGGVGKTRLARHLAAAVADRYADGVLFVEFGDGGPDDVEPSLAAAVRLSDGGRPGTDSFADRIVEVLAVRRQLVVLDNCEHVADEVAALVERIVSGAAGIDVVLTSREPLRVDGEHVLGVDPLEPDAAAQLLTDRIGAGDPAAGSGPDHAELVAELCRRLDGLPLALELAAARALPLGLRGLLAAIDGAREHPFEVLRGGRRTASSRHRSLRNVVEWSYRLLDEGQRTLFERMSVFAGPVEHSAVVEVCGTADALPDLVDRSLVVRHAGEPARFGMLETLRAFGRSRLITGPDATRLRVRHASWARQLAGQLSQARRGPGEALAIARFDAHLADLRRAHTWLCETGPVEDLLQLTMLFAELGHLRGRVDLVRSVEETLHVVGALGPEPTAVRASTHPLVPRLLGLLATSGWQRGDLATAEAYATRAIAMAAAGDPASARDGYAALANVASFRGELDDALRHGRTARDLAAAADDVEGRFLALVDLAIIAIYAEDDEAFTRDERELAGLLDRLDSPTAAAYVAYVRGEWRAERGASTAAPFLEEAIRRAESVDSWFVAGIARHTLLTSAARGSAHPDAMVGNLGPLIDHWRRFGAWTHLWMAIRALIETLARLHRHADAAVLLGALRASPRATRVFGADAVREQAVESAARVALGLAFEPALAEGAALGDAEAIALARRLTQAHEVSAHEFDAGVARAARSGLI